MDDQLRKQLADRLKFYRDLGIEDFYRRDPAAEVKLQPAARREIAEPAGDESVRLAVPVSLPTPSPAAVSPRALGGMPAQSLSLFEAPTAPRREHETLEEIRADLGDCHRCRLADGRKTIVFGQGNPGAEVMFVGEGPGADEDEQGLPFVGRAGQLLNRMIQLAGMKREEVYIANIVKCRPPGNRTPLPDEIETCSPFLFRQIESIRPRLVVCLGAPAAKTLLGIREGITKVRGRFFELGKAKALATVHPAYVLRNPREEKILREDFEKIIEFLRSS